MNKTPAMSEMAKLTSELLQSIRRDAAEELKHHVLGGPLPISSTLGIINKIKALHRAGLENEIINHVCGENPTVTLPGAKAKPVKAARPVVRLYWFPESGRFLATLPDGRTLSNTRARDLTKRIKDLGYEVKMVT